MTSLDADAIRQFANGLTRERLKNLDVFSEIESTNSYLMQIPGPQPGMINIAATGNQTAGRGRHGKTWQSPPGSGLCLSAAYTFEVQPENLPALTLVLGLGVVDALEEVGATDIELKWPNDLVAQDGKLGGILTEVHRQSATAVTIVTGIGINVDLQRKLDFGMETDWARNVVDLKSICDSLPSREELAGIVTSHLLKSFVEFEKEGFAAVVDRWARYDWLLGRDITIDITDRQFSGVGAGVADDGALLVDTDSGIRRVSSGTIVMAGSRGNLR
jgi:BirA family biotin operon repressor/biotin-[acetyl-CoA-carboxylase] ligase